MKKGNLYLIPNVIAEETSDKVICQQVVGVIQKTHFYLVENVRTARRYISSLKTGVVIDDLHFEVLDKKTKNEQLSKIMEPLFNGHDIGVISESGCPGVADPGALAVDYAHKNNIKVTPLVGPSSILLALMGSGFSGQKFCFHGYLPIDKKEAQKAIQQLELESIKNSQTQIVIETPYRNHQLFDIFIQACNPNTKLCVAREISGTHEFIKTQTIAQWKDNKPQMHKIPTVFLLYGG